MKTICITIPYFGKWPRWFNLFLKTCKYNPTVRWLFYTDCGRLKNAPDNIEFINATIEDFNLLTSEKIGFKINVRHTYKLCEFKPAYGVIFEDYLRKYDFWGCGDTDVLFGNIRKFITEELLTNYDIISTNSKYITGHFTLFKNITSINRIYEMSPDYKMVFQSQEHYNFDECNFEWNCLLSDATGANIVSMTHLIKDLVNKNKIKVFLKTIMKEDTDYKKKWKIHWDGGELIDTDSGEELLYFHFRKVKNNSKFLIPNEREIPDSFYMSKNGTFYAKEIKGMQRFYEILKNYLKIKADSIIGIFGNYLRFNHPTLYYKIKRIK